MEVRREEGGVAKLSVWHRLDRLCSVHLEVHSKQELRPAAAPLEACLTGTNAALPDPILNLSGSQLNVQRFNASHTVCHH